jgi:hypothetical protein
MKIKHNAQYRVLCDYIEGESDGLQAGQLVRVNYTALFGRTGGSGAYPAVILAGGLTVPLEIFKSICEEFYDDKD